MHNFEKLAPLLDRISYVKYLQNYRKTRNAYLKKSDRFQSKWEYLLK
jgi:hypothetical protein